MSHRRVSELSAATGYTKAELWIVDLADFASVKAFADRFEQEGGRLDIFVENAAIFMDKYESTKDGWETAFVSLRFPLPQLTDRFAHRFQVSCLSTPLLAFLLLPTMIKTAREHSTIPRLVVVSSEMHYWASIEKEVRENPDMLKTFGSEKYCTPT